MGGGEKGESKKRQMRAGAHDDRSTAAAANSKATVKAHESGEQSEEGAPLKSNMHVTSAESALTRKSKLEQFALTWKSKLELQASRNADWLQVPSNTSDVQTVLQTAQQLGQTALQVASAEFALKSESVLQASRNAEEATLEAETTESATAMSKSVGVDDNAAQVAIQLRQQPIERGKRIFKRRQQRKSVSPRAQSFSTRASNSSKMQVMLQTVLDSQATQAVVAGQRQAEMKAQMKAPMKGGAERYCCCCR